MFDRACVRVSGWMDGRNDRSIDRSKETKCTIAITHKTIKDLPIATAWPASKAAFHCLYFSPKRTTTMSSRRMRGDFKHGLACDFKASPCLKR